MNYSEGSPWSKWDLHVHTPDSIVHEYSGNKEQQWRSFIQDLAALPPEFKVIGINDYIFLDGYRKVLAAAAEGRLPNIDLILPVIELRLDRFGGTDKHFSRVNCHLLFSDELSPDLIEGQFLNTLKSKYQLAPEVTDTASTWQAVPTRESLTDLGRMIIDSIPADKRQGNPSPLHLGFSNINFSIKSVRAALQTHYLKDRCLVAIGKAEWADIKWSDQLIAEKKTIINSADMVFTAAASPSACLRSREKLKEEAVKDLLFDCSDAHALSTTEGSNRIGNCFTWIKADTTFEGLRQSLREYDDRVFIGDEPPKLGVVRSEGGRFIKTLGIHRKVGSDLAENWFECELYLHTDLVAVIGRKGSGKSALTDIIGLLSDTHREQEFSFLNSKRFRLPKDNKARHFEGRLTFHNGKSVIKGLEEDVDRTSPQRVNYIPQHFFERLCGDIAKGDDTDFQEEIEDVVFSRLDEASRLGQRTLRGLIDYRTQKIQDAAGLLREDLDALNEEIADVERQILPEYADEVRKKLEQRLQELKDHEGAKPEEVPKPKDALESDDEPEEDDELAKRIKEREAIEKDLKAAEARAVEVSKKLAAIVKVKASIANLKDRQRREEESVAEELRLLGLKWIDLVKVEVDQKPLSTAKADLQTKKVTVDRLLAEEGEASLRRKLRACTEAANSLRDKLNEPQRKYQSYIEAVKVWESKRAEIIGDEETPGTIADFQAIQKKVGALPDKLAALEEKRKAQAGVIYDKLVEIVDLYRELYRPVQDFMDGNATVQEKLGLNFDVFLKNTGFEEGFLARIRRNVRGSFSGPDGPAALNAIVEETNFDDKESTLFFLQKVSAYLHHKNGDSNLEEFVVASQIREKVSTPQDLYQYVFGMEYLQPQFTLAMSEKSLNSLSPGERGALLFIFYLLVDENKDPVVLDQPDENLDNETVYDLLVPCIREAKKHRQVIVVTHNPNIAVVCDADQIVHASIDKLDGYRVTYTTGAIENPEMNKHLLNVLEGTRPAFDDRDNKYLA